MTENGSHSSSKALHRRELRLARKAAEEARRKEQDERFMAVALEEAQRAAEAGEVPIGAVVVYEPLDRATGASLAEPVIIARGHNLRETSKSPSAHGEFLAMEEAARALDQWRLTDCTVYVTLEPCIMCTGLMHQARIRRCVYGAADPKAGAAGSLYAIHEDQRLNHRFEVTAGVCGEECTQLLQEFFARRRQATPPRTSPSKE